MQDLAVERLRILGGVGVTGLVGFADADPEEPRVVGLDGTALVAGPADRLAQRNGLEGAQAPARTEGGAEQLHAPWLIPVPAGVAGCAHDDLVSDDGDAHEPRLELGAHVRDLDAAQTLRPWLAIGEDVHPA